MVVGRFVALILAMTLCAIPATALIDGSVSITGPDDGDVLNGNVTIDISLAYAVNLTVTLNGPGGGWIINVTNDTVGDTQIVWPTANTSFPNGAYEIEVFALNASNEADTDTATIDVSIDNTPPNMTSLMGGTLTQSVIRLQVAVNSTPAALDSCFYNLTKNVSGGHTIVAANTVPSGSFTVTGDISNYSTNVTGQTDGLYNITWNCTDELGQSSLLAIGFSIADTTDPRILTISEGSLSSDDVSISVTSDEPVTLTIAYGETASLGSSQDGSVTASTSETVDLTDLDAGTDYYYNVTACDEADNCVTNGTFTFTTSSLGSGGGSGGGGGGGGYAPATSTVESTLSRVWGAVPEGPFTYAPESSLISDIDLFFNKTTNRVRISIVQHKERPSNIQPLTGPLVYRYVQIEHEGLAGNVESYSVTFRVPQEWLASENVGVDLIKLYRLETGVWTPYDAVPGDVVAGQQTFTATVPGFSSFAVGASASEEPVVAPSEETEPVAEETTPVESPQDSTPTYIESPAPIESDEGGWLMPILLTIGALALLAVGGYFGVNQYRAFQVREVARKQELVRDHARIESMRMGTQERAHAKDSASLSAEVAFERHAQPETHEVFKHPQYEQHVAPLRDYVAKMRAHNVPHDRIVEKLKEAGWNPQVITHETAEKKI